jgi:hypothetical protein
MQSDIINKKMPEKCMQDGTSKKVRTGKRCSMCGMYLDINHNNFCCERCKDLYADIHERIR